MEFDSWYDRKVLNYSGAFLQCMKLKSIGQYIIDIPSKINWINKQRRLNYRCWFFFVIITLKHNRIIFSL